MKIYKEFLNRLDERREESMSFDSYDQIKNAVLYLRKF